MSGRADFLYSLQNGAAFEDLSAWQRELEAVVNEEIEVECPSCTPHLYLEMTDGQVVVTPDPNVLPSNALMRPRATSDATKAEARLLELCQAHQQEEIAEALLRVFGEATCPNCSTKFAIEQAIA